MSRQNKVNKTNYVQRGRLTPDEMAREIASTKASARKAAGAADERLRGKAQERVRAKGGERGASRRRSGREE